MIKIIQKNSPHLEKNFLSKSIFLNTKWLKVIEKSFNLNCHYVIFKNKQKTILPFYEIRLLLKKNFVSIPFSFNINLDKNQENYLVQKLCENRDFFKNFNDVVIKSQFLNYNFSKKDFFKTKYNVYKIKLDKNTYKNFSKNIKRALNKFSLFNFKIINVYSSKEFDEFYNNYVKSSKKLETFFYPKIFFYNLFKEFNENFTIVSAYKKNQYLGGHLLLFDKNKNEIIYFLSSKSFEGNNISIDKILIYKAILIAQKKKFQYLNLGRVSRSHEGLNNFKKLFGSEKHEVNYFSLNKRNLSILDQQSILKEIVKFFIKYLPLSIYKYINNKLFKYLGIY